MTGRREIEEIVGQLTDLYDVQLVSQIRESAGAEAAELVAANLAGIARQVAVRLVGDDPTAASDAAEVVRAVMPTELGEEFAGSALGRAVHAAETGAVAAR
ncbi:hypothetical protein [Nocardia acidivorans]|uniref:hypothetical protein n=1 Tax=Nocardia acidivorans TaxID=404580 RepID=UPI0012FC2326|nr:hypothetical protein [Nocardia acidivorans]